MKNLTENMKWIFAGVAGIFISSSVMASDLKIITFGNAGLGVPNATVQLTEANAIVLTGTTDAMGNLSFVNVPSGAFRIKISAVGYSDYSDANEGNVIKPGYNYAFSAFLGNPSGAPSSNGTLSSVTVPLSSVSQILPQYTSTKWPNFAALCSDQFPQGNSTSYANNSYFNARTLSTTVHSPTFISEVGLNCATDVQGNFAPSLNLMHEFVHARHDFKFGNQSAAPATEDRITPNLTEKSSAPFQNQVYSANLLNSSETDVYVDGPRSQFVFEYGPSFCINKDHQPVTDPLLFDQGECEYGDFVDGSLMGFSEDVMSTSIDAHGNTIVRVHYKIKKLWLVVTVTEDGKTPASPDALTAYVSYIPLLVSGKSGNPIFAKDRFSATADALNEYNFVGINADGSKLQPESAKVYLKLSAAFYANLKAAAKTDDNDASADIQPIYVETGGERIYTGFGMALGYNRAPPTNRPSSWVKPPYLPNTPVTFENYVTPEHDVGLRTKTGVRAEPTGNFAAALAEFQQNAPSLGVGTLPQFELLSLIEDATKAFSNLPKSN